MSILAFIAGLVAMYLCTGVSVWYASSFIRISLFVIPLWPLFIFGLYHGGYKESDNG
jgi:hypothetical protein